MVNSKVSRKRRVFLGSSWHWSWDHDSDSSDMTGGLVMNNTDLIRVLEDFQRYTKIPFGKYAATLALKKLKGGYEVGLTKEEIYSIKEHRKGCKNFPRVKRLWPVTLSAYDNSCPHCQKRIWGNSKIIRVLKETPDIDLVSLICRCGTIFRKYEDKREVI